MIPVYILGILMRFGSQHGYQIKKTVADNISDFTQIKLPTIYYHLEKMKKDGLLDAILDKDSNRPEKTVYSITDKGKAAFADGLAHLLNFSYRPSFDSDAVFYFSDHLPKAKILSSLIKYTEELSELIASIEKHRKEAYIHIPNSMKAYADIVFHHHIIHYNAERDWALYSIEKLHEGERI